MEWLRRLVRHDAREPANEAARWVVVDTETTGIDPARDALVAIGGVAIAADGIRAADSFEIVVQHTGPTDAENIVIHGLGRQTLEAGVPAAEALRAFRAWVDGAPCCAFHVDFDRRVLDRAASRAGVPALAGPWLDVEPLCAALRPDALPGGTRTLDEWLAVCGLACPGRHNAARDALATAELLLYVRALAARQRTVGFAALASLQRQPRWLGARR